MGKMSRTKTIAMPKYFISKLDQIIEEECLVGRSALLREIVESFFAEIRFVFPEIMENQKEPKKENLEIITCSFKEETINMITKTARLFGISDSDLIRIIFFSFLFKYQQDGYTFPPKIIAPPAKKYTLRIKKQGEIGDNLSEI